MSPAVATTFFCILILSLSNVTVNASSIRLFCPFPNSELCKLHHRLNNNKFNGEPDIATLDGESPYAHSLDEETEKLRNQLEAEIEVFRNALEGSENLLRCVNLGDDGCSNGSLPGSGKDDDYLIGGNNPGKRNAINGIKNHIRLRHLGKHN
ncbi:hypothetical protein Bhyg_16817 [Pseudolycoriella hygida]|uniref:Uncharacterized protein n=1 Tax=Pseudolycoriella hygida TaxID=35572 RepID=A0A9Q0MKS8_9DIPT|nr:hypothetical protein Bhyg_16817 [Pseudolycoriella hygida]